VQRAIPCKEPFRAKSHSVQRARTASTPAPPAALAKLQAHPHHRRLTKTCVGGEGGWAICLFSVLLIKCIAYQMHCLSNALLIKCIAYQMHCLSNALLIKCVGYSMVVKHCRRTHPFSLSLSIHRHLAYLPPARPTHTPPPHQARRPSHSSPALLSGCVRVCGREGGRVLGHAMHWPWNAAAIQRIGHTGAPAPLARLRTHTPPPHRPQAEPLLSGCGGERVGGWAICC